MFSPDNSILNRHVIDEIGIDHNGSIHAVTNRNVYRIFDDLWECLDNGKEHFYWVMAFTAGPAGILYLLEDFSASSSSADTTTLCEYQNNTWNKMKPDFMTCQLAFFTAMKADRRNYCWAASIDGSSYVLHVYNGTSWEEPTEGLFLGDQIYYHKSRHG